MFPKLKGKAILSPMEGVTDVAFRTLCKKYGAALTYTEFVNSDALIRGKSKIKIQTSELEVPVAVQIFGSSINNLVNASKLLTNFDIIDINCGCPAWKVIKTGSGSALLNNPEKIKDLIKKLAQTRENITLKIRTGIDSNSINAVEIAKLAESSGASAIAVHGRTQKQAYKGEADWDVIKQVKLSVSIPVIGNGDVFSPETFKKRLDESGVDYIMIARGAIGNPYIFKQINDYLETGKYDQKDKFELFKEYLKLAKQFNLSFKIIKSQAMYFTKGTKKGSILRFKISAIKNIEELETLMFNQPKHF